MTSQIQILRRQELDAFLATAFSSDLMNALHLQEMNVSTYSHTLLIYSKLLYSLFVQDLL